MKRDAIVPFQLLDGFVVMLAGGISGGAEMSADPFATQPRPWVESIYKLTLEEYEGTLKHWAGKFPSLLTLEKRGDSLEGMPIYLLKITDPSVPAADKQVVMVSALHGVPERTGATTILHFAEWLLGDSELARETRRKQIVLLMPMLNPYAFFRIGPLGNKEGVDLYDPQTKWWDVAALKLSAPDKTPELATFLAVMDEYQPDMHLDCMGPDFRDTSRPNCRRIACSERGPRCSR